MKKLILILSVIVLTATSCQKENVIPTEEQETTSVIYSFQKAGCKEDIGSYDKLLRVGVGFDSVDVYNGFPVFSANSTRTTPYGEIVQLNFPIGFVVSFMYYNDLDSDCPVILNVFVDGIKVHSVSFPHPNKYVTYRFTREGIEEIELWNIE